MANKYLALQKDVFDISKVTVVGSPTITSDGVASELDNTANILFPIKNEDLVGKSWTISGACLPVAGVGSRKVFAFGNNAEPSFGNIAYNEQYNRVDFQFKTGDTTSSSNIVYIRIVLDEIPSKIYFNLSFDRNSKTYTLKAKSDTSLQWQEGSYIATTDNPDVYNLSYYSTQSLAIRAWANSTGTYTWSIPVDLKYYSVEIEGKEVYTPTKPTYLLEKRKPKVWNKGQFTVVGNPSISDDGVISSANMGIGSSTDYVKANFDLSLLRNKSWHIRQQAHIVFGTNCQFAIPFKPYSCFYYNANWNSLVLDQDTTADGTGTNAVVVFKSIEGIKNKVQSITPNATEADLTLDLYYLLEEQKYYFTATYQNTTWTSSIFTGEAETYNSQLSALYDSSAYFRLGETGNLKETKIYTDNNLVFDGGAETYVYDPSKFTVVGSPTITEYGIASGFSSNQGLNIQTFDFSTISEFKVDFKFTTPSEIDNDDDIIVGMAAHNTTGFMLRWRSGDRKLSAIPYLSSSAARININSVVLELNKTYYGQFIFDVKNNKTIVGVSEDGINYVSTSLILTENIPTYWKNMSIGYSGSTTLYFKGSIDLPAISITVDGKEVFTGAKESYYVLRR